MHRRSVIGKVTSLLKNKITNIPVILFAKTSNKSASISKG